MTSYGETALVRAMGFLADSQAAIANNLANVDTGGFKRRLSIAEPVQGEFHRLLQAQLPTVGYREYAVWEQGNTRETGNAFNVALDDARDAAGNQRVGFFKVQDDQGRVYFTRDGELQLDQKGRLVTRAGLRYLDQNNQELVLQGDTGTPSKLAIAPNGTISDPTTGQSWGPLAVLAPPDAAELAAMQPAGGGLYLARDAQALQPAPDVLVRQGQLESSNVDSLVELVRMINVQRSFAATQRALSGLGRMQESLASNTLR